MKKWTLTLVAGVFLILAVNAVALLGAAYNRSDEPESTLLMSQRELIHHRLRGDKDNSGINLAMKWRVESEKSSRESDNDLRYSSGHWGSPSWLNKDKLIELGFDVEKFTRKLENENRIKDILPREALIVMELNGKAYQQELKIARDFVKKSRELLAKNPRSEKYIERARWAELYIKEEEQQNTRLFAIDASTDLNKLRTVYPNRSHYAIVKGLIYPSIRSYENKILIDGNIRDVHAEQINVPFNFRRVFDTTDTYEVKVAFGKRLEPWIIAASKSQVTK